MSKYENLLNYDNDVKNPIMDGEKVIWEGKPKKSAFITNKIMRMAPFAILWLLFDSFFIIASLGTKDSGIMFFIVPFFLLHLAPVWIWISHIVTANRRWKNTKYYITDRRIIIQNGFIAKDYQTIYYKDIKNVKLHIGIFDKLLGVGDVYFDMGFLGENSVITGFLDIENYNEVYQMTQKTVLDIQTDIEYPNALRPDNNPGYNTGYNVNDEK